ncbi:tetratricopeptide repeat protein [Chitinophaga sp. Hz27]|uniref:tetratricopeptide repeat protein n=1 Tax=Chitinophaga sp. Hz27 TaxID=3347169 RepID=UPI0035E0FC07
MISCRKIFLLAISLLFMLSAYAVAWPSSRDKAKHLCQEGIAMKKAGNQLAAVRLFNAAISADSTYTEAYCELGDAYFVSRHYQEALLACIKARRLGAVSVSKLIGLSYYQLNRYDEALEALEEARAEEPSNGTIPFRIAQLYAQRGEYQQSILYYQSALKLDSLDAQGWYELGMMHYNVAGYTASMVAFQHALDAGFKADDGFLLNAGVAAMQAGQLDKSLTFLQQAYDRHPEDETILFNLAHVTYRKNDFASAVINWEKLLKRKPTDAFVKFMLGKSYIGLGEKEKGMALCDAAAAEK